MTFALSAFGAALPPIVESRPVDVQPPRQGGEVAAAESAPVQSGVPAGTIEERVARLERQMNNQALLEMLNRLELLQQEVQELRGMLELQSHKISSIEQRQRELYLDIDRRIRGIEEQGQPAAAAQGQDQTAATAGAGSPGTGQAPGASAPAVAALGAGVGAEAGATEPADSAAERAAYQQAFDELQAGNYEKAVADFQSFLERYPEGEYSANAQYWLGEAKYVMRQFSDAISEFNKVLQRYPDSGKAPDALLKLGFSHYELQEWEKAGEALNRVVEQYPASTARQLAENRLHQMRLQGRRP